MSTIRGLIAVPVLLVFGQGLLVAQEAPDRIFINGKIIAVDDYFSIHEAVAVRGERFLATGSSEAIQALADADTVVTDLGGRTVIPGLIDNHNHVIRATEYWPNEARLDGVTSRAEALGILGAKAEALADGDWLMSLGGWSEAQFLDSQADFTHADNITAAQLERVRHLGMNVQLRSNPVMGGREPVFEHFGDAAYHLSGRSPTRS